MFARTDTYTMSYGLAQQKRKLVRSWEMPGLSGRPCRRNWTHVSLGGGGITQRSPQCHASLTSIFQTVSTAAVAKQSCALSNHRTYQSPPSHSVLGSVPETPPSILLPQDLCWAVPPYNTDSYCLMTSFSSQLKCPFLREAFPNLPTQSQQPAPT